MSNDSEQKTHIPEALPTGTKIGQDYTILRVLGQGGFGITYLAQDEMLSGQVVIKENMPGDFALRDRDTLVITPRLKQEENYAWARERFLDEARLLHQLNHPNIVPVTRAFSALNTAYYVMPHVGATELWEAVRNTPEGRSEANLVSLLRQLLNALEYLHGKGLLHRDLNPANILMANNGTPVIIDFGAAREAVSGRTHTMLECAGYTPIEQLKQHGNVGPWTDLYALGATFYHLITGIRPPRSIDRMDDDPYAPLSSRRDLRQQYSARFLASIDKALDVRPKRRWQTAADWANDLPGSVAPAAATQKKETTTSKPVPPPMPLPRKKIDKLWVGTAVAVTLLMLTAVGSLVFLVLRNKQEPHPQALATATEQAPAEESPQATVAAAPQAPAAAAPQAPVAAAPQERTAEECLAKGYECERNRRFEEAVDWYRKAADQGLAEAQCCLGSMYEHGKGINQDYEEARSWYRKAAQQGLALAHYRIGDMYYYGKGVAEDFGEAASRYRRAAEQGLAMAQNDLGYMYGKGKGVPHDDEEAVNWYRKAALQNHAEAQNNLGNMYKDGRGVAQDFNEAVKWYRKAADQGHAGAQNNLGLMYEYGKGVTRDYAEACNWYRKAADQGNASAQYNLADMYEFGKGVTKNLATAREWYRKAADQGHEKAQKKLRELGQ